MLKRITYLFIYLFIYLIGKSQVNLVPNPSFEDRIGNNCFISMGVTNSLTSNMYLKDWYTSEWTTPDYYNICANFDPGNPPPGESTVPLHCFGYQNPKTGNAFVGIAIYDKVITTDTAHMFVEYVSVKLKSPLKANTCYYGEFYANLAEVSGLVSNQIGMYLSQNTFTTTIGSFTNSIQPQIQWDTTKYFTDTLNWVKISGYFVAQGGEEHLTIGNFKDGVITKKINSGHSWSSPGFCGVGIMNTSYIHIDDVSLYELPTPQLQSNAITICPNADTLVLGDTARIQTRYQWFANGTAIDTTSFIKVKPNQTTTYVLQSTNCTTTTQTIVVTYSNNCEPVVVVEPIIPNVFTPNNDSINDVWRFSLGKGNVLNDLKIVNRWGNLISTNNETNKQQNIVLWDGYTTSGEPVSSGVYFYVLQYTDPNGEEHKKNGYITLIR